MNYKSKPASQDEIAIYCLIGEAICAVQHVEDVLSHSIALKKDVKEPFSVPKPEANRILEKYRSLTLGKAVGLSKKEQLYSEPLLQELEKFLVERNWLVHKSVILNRDVWDMNVSRGTLLRTIKGISARAGKIYHAIEEDMMEFSEAKGLDMSRIRAEKRKHYDNE